MSSPAPAAEKVAGAHKAPTRQICWEPWVTLAAVFIQEVPLSRPPTGNHGTAN
jgi:hypothetical protein